MVQSRTWLTTVKIIFLTAAAIVVLDCIMLSMKRTPAPEVSPIRPTSSPATPPSVTERQAIESTRVTFGGGRDVTRETPSISPSSGPSAAPDAVPPDVPEPSLSMTLIGTLASPGAKIAIIVSDGKEQVVHEGDRVGESQFTVREIRENLVILVMSGVQKRLHLPSFQPPAPTATPVVPQLSPTPSPTPETGKSESGTTILTNRERHEAMKNPRFEDFRILPHRKEGKDYGAKVVFLKPGSFLHRCGLNPDDILLHVNRMPVTNAEDAANVIKAFQYEDRIVMQIDRGGRFIELQVEFR